MKHPYPVPITSCYRLSANFTKVTLGLNESTAIAWASPSDHNVPFSQDWNQYQFYPEHIPCRVSFLYDYHFYPYVEARWNFVDNTGLVVKTICGINYEPYSFGNYLPPERVDYLSHWWNRFVDHNYCGIQLTTTGYYLDYDDYGKKKVGNRGIDTFEMSLPTRQDDQGKIYSSHGLECRYLNLFQENGYYPIIFYPDSDPYDYSLYFGSEYVWGTPPQFGPTAAYCNSYTRHYRKWELRRVDTGVVLGTGSIAPPGTLLADVHKPATYPLFNTTTKVLSNPCTTEPYVQVRMYLSGDYYE